MTAVVGILNMRGVAIAADSAVTRSRRNKGTKCTKNGSKMIRLSNVVPISVMITGNAEFISNPWDIVIRRYRQKRGDIQHPTVEACMHDFFAYIAETDVLWDERLCRHWIRHELKDLFEHIGMHIPTHLKETSEDGSLLRGKSLLKAYKSELKKILRYQQTKGKSPQFEGYTIEQFREYAKPVIDKYFANLHKEKCIRQSEETIIADFQEDVREEVEMVLMEDLTRRSEYGDGTAMLVFSGYGNEQEYPSLVAACVNEGFDHRVNYHVKPEDLICISEECPVAICPFAQDDVVMAILKGLHGSFGKMITSETSKFYFYFAERVFEDKCYEDDNEFLDLLSEVQYQDLIDRFGNTMRAQLNKNQREWEKMLRYYDLKSMAALAQSLIDLTGLHRILTFEQEAVGGPVDVAVISKNDGFTWLSRKSWYHHKDVNGVYGSMGI